MLVTCEKLCMSGWLLLCKKQELPQLWHMPRVLWFCSFRECALAWLHYYTIAPDCTLPWRSCGINACKVFSIKMSQQPAEDGFYLFIKSYQLVKVHGYSVKVI